MPTSKTSTRPKNLLKKDATISIRESWSCSNDLGEQTSRFRLQRLAQGQGLTIGNTLRRVLLTELEGTAITAVQIKGINNEFATIPGVREDVLEILLNLKQIKFQGLLETAFLTSIVLKGPQLVTADHLVLPLPLIYLIQIIILRLSRNKRI